MLVARPTGVPLAQTVLVQSQAVMPDMMTVIQCMPMAVKPTSIPVSIPAGPAPFSAAWPTVPPFVTPGTAPSPAAPRLGVIAMPITPTVVRSIRIHRIFIADFVMTPARWRMVHRFARMEAARSVLVILGMQTVTQIPRMVVKST